MRFTSRDVRLVRDVALSHLMSRDQFLLLDYFGSVTRTNTRLRELCAAGMLKRLTTPFLGQSLYMAGEEAPELLGDRIAPLLVERAGSPRFVRHALSVNNVRIALLKKGGTDWRFEQQLWRTLGKVALRPDGLLYTKQIPAFIEVDLGHVSAPKFKEKLLGYRDLASAENCGQLYGFPDFRLLVVTTGTRRARHLRSLLPHHARFDYLVQTFEELGVPMVGCWS